MTCSCPKCHAQIELDLSKIPDAGHFTPCPECKGRFWVNKETYARMALKKEGNVYCDRCGNELDRSIVCSGCGVMYPDYYLVQASRPPRRQAEKPDLFSLSFSKTVKPTYTVTPSYTSTKSSQARPAVPLQKITGLVLLLLIAVGLGYFYHMKKVEERFSKNYIRALYVIKSGADISFNVCATMSSEWKANKDTGNNATPHIRAEDEERLNRVKDASDNLMKLLNEPPKKLLDSKGKLDALYNGFNKAHSLAVTPADSFSNFSRATTQIQNDFNAEIKDLKASMPENLTKEFERAKIKYKILKNI